MQVGEITAVAAPAQLELAIALAHRADEPTAWPGLGSRDPGRLRLIVVPDEAGMQELSGGRAPSWGAGIAIPGSRTLLIRANASNPLQVLRHELAHLALRRAIRSRVPRWFDEGYAAYAAGEWDRLDALTLNLSVMRGAVPELPDLDAALRGAGPEAEASYALAMSAVMELARRNPSNSLEPLMRELAAGEPFADALRHTTGLNQGQFAAEWHRTIRRRYGLITWMAAGGLWVLIAAAVILAGWLRRRADRPRRRALDDGWIIESDEAPGAPELDRKREDV